MRKEKKSNPVMMKEKKREVPVHETPKRHQFTKPPSVDGAHYPPGDLQLGVDDHHVPTEEVMH